MKATSAVTDPYDNIIIPKNSQKTDWNVELAIVIEKKASYVAESEAIDYVAGYCLHNDVSERAYQLEMGGTLLNCRVLLLQNIALHQSIDNTNSHSRPNRPINGIGQQIQRMLTV